MGVADRVTIDAALFGSDEGPSWVMGTYDGIPIQVRLTPGLATQLGDDARIGPDILPRFEAAVAERIEQGDSEFGREMSSGRVTMVVTMDALDDG